MSRFVRVEKCPKLKWIFDLGDPIGTGVKCDICDGYGFYYVDRHISELVRNGMATAGSEKISPKEMGAYIRAMKRRTR